jgi:hypothetical protein
MRSSKLRVFPARSDAPQHEVGNFSQMISI